MKYAAWVALLLGLTILAFGYLTRFAPGDRQAAATPPLSLEGYLDEKLAEAPKKKTTVKADNQACYVCHGNYDGEELVMVHAKEDVGCVKCHGQSYDHRNDEDNVTPPEIMYWPKRIGPACMKCHETHDAPAHKVIAQWQQRCPAKTRPEQLVCTDCHGRHRLKFRTVWWDKKKGKLVVRKGQTTKKAKDYTKVDDAPAPLRKPK